MTAIIIAIIVSGGIGLFGLYIFSNLFAVIDDSSLDDPDRRW